MIDNYNKIINLYVDNYVILINNKIKIKISISFLLKNIDKLKSLYKLEFYINDDRLISIPKNVKILGIYNIYNIKYLECDSLRCKFLDLDKFMSVEHPNLQSLSIENLEIVDFLLFSNFLDKIYKSRVKTLCISNFIDKNKENIINYIVNNFGICRISNNLHIFERLL